MSDESGDDDPDDITQLPDFNNGASAKEQRVIQDIEANLPPGLLYRGYTSFQRFTFGFDEVELRITLDWSNTQSPMTSSVRNNDYQISRKKIDSLRGTLRDIIARETTSNETPLSVLSAGLLILLLLEETASFLHAYRTSLALSTPNPSDGYWDFSTTHNITPLLSRDLQMKGLDLTTVHGAATHVLGKTPSQICNDILPDWRILHCEKHPAQGPAGPLPAAPAADAGAVAARRALAVDNGSVYGRGIYSSPNAGYAMLYSCDAREQIPPSELPGRKLIVCATLMGRSACLDWDDDWYNMSEPFPGADSHINPTQNAYIVFNAAQILPCYVLHLDYTGKQETEDFYAHLSALWSKRKMSDKREDVNESRFPGGRQRLKQQLIAKGQKFFSYGYGPVAGNRLVIEDVADVDEDEEEYGEYQLVRKDAEVKFASIWDEGWGKDEDDGEKGEVKETWELEGTTAFDEYAKARKARINRRNPKAD